MFDFDRVIERRGTHASKWDHMARLSGIKSPDAIPMWVADMDFAAPPGVTAALTAEIERATHGYYADTGTWAAALADWMARRHGLRIDPGWVSPTPGIVSGLGLILQAVSAPGDEVVVFPPAYHAFRKIILANERRILDAQLVETAGPLRDGPRCVARQADAANQSRVPVQPAQSRRHRLVGRMSFARWPLLRRARPDPGIRRDSLRSRFRRRQAHPDDDGRARDRRSPDHLRRRDQDLQSRRRPCRRLHHLQSGAEERLDARIGASGLGSYNGFGMIATEAAWRTGEAWLDALLPYLAESRDLFDARIEAAAPGARSMHLDGTYLAWVDFSGTGLTPEDVAARVAEPRPHLCQPGRAVRAGRQDVAALQFCHAAADPRGSA